MSDHKSNDLEFEDHVLTGVKRGKDGWEILYDRSLCFWCPDVGVVPVVGSIARFYGRGFGYPVRGLDIDGREVFYRTPAQEEARHLQMVADMKLERRRAFEANRTKLDADYEALPPEFQARIDRFRRNREDFRWEHEAYEMSACVDAVRIARALDTPEAVREFHALPWEQQKARVPDLFDGHSGNSFGAACSLAVLWLTSPELVDKQHGALCPLVGCGDYGCYASERAKGAADGV